MPLSGLTKMTMLNDDCYKIYLVLGLVTFSFKFGLSVSWGIALAVGMIITLPVQWFHNRSAAKSWQNAIDDNYTVAKEYGYKTEEIFTDNITNTKNIILEKTLNVNKGVGYWNKVNIFVHLGFSGVQIVYHTANPADEQVSLIIPLDSNLTASFIQEIERHALCEKPYAPSLR